MRALVGFLLLLSIVGCRKKEKTPEAGPGAEPGTPSGRSSADTPPIASSAAPPMAPTLYAERVIPAGDAPDGSWTASYKIEQKTGGDGLDWSRALTHCSALGRSLCTETQWLRACVADGEIGRTETWTLTADAAGVVVRGGAEGCSVRKSVQAGETHPARGAFCCDRAVAIRTENKNESFLAATSQKLLAYERALREKNPEALGAFYDDTVTYLGQELGRDALLKQHAEAFEKSPDAALYFDQCSVKVETENLVTSLLSDCGTVARGAEGLRGMVERVLFGGPAGKIQYVGDPGAMKKREQKERIRSFLPSSK